MSDLIVGIDAGTSVIKSVAFDFSGRQVALASRPNAYDTGPGGAATQPLDRTWADCAATLAALAEEVDDLAGRTAAIAVTGQGDGTWLIDGAGEPVGDGWLWLDARATAIVDDMRARPEDRARYEATGTGLAACQQGPQLLWMKQNTPEVLAAAATAMHCKDWLYLKLTGERATDASEGTFTFGNCRTRRYDDTVIEALGLEAERRLLPPMLDGTRIHHPLSDAAACATGLLSGTPVVLGFVDVACTALGAGIFDETRPGCTVVGSTGMHMRLTKAADVALNDDRTGYTMVLPADGYVSQMQSNMASTINIDWILGVGAELLSDMGHETDKRSLIAHLEGWLERGRPGAAIYQPYISEAGERGPFVDGRARAGFTGLSTRTGFADLVRCVVEGLGLAARDCYEATGGVPAEVRLSGGAARSHALRGIMGAMLDADVRTSSREEAGAAGAAMMAAISLGHYADMASCVAEWVTPLLGPAEAPDPALVETYAPLFRPYKTAREALVPVWHQLAAREGIDG